MTRFRPCIDLHEGQVKQIVGGSIREKGDKPETNFVSNLSAAHFAELYANDQLQGGHVIQLGAGNEQAAKSALSAYPQGLQIGGSITLKNAAQWLETGACQVIVTSWLFDNEGNFLPDNLAALVQEIGRNKLVIDLSCRSNNSEQKKEKGEGWHVSMNRWSTPTTLQIDKETLSELSNSCAEFLVHAADVEGKCQGIDEHLVSFLAKHSPIPVTYAGGARSIEDLHLVQKLSEGKVDLTIGSALDIFGGSGASYADCIAFNKS